MKTAQTIYNQLGGNKFGGMIGIKDLVGDTNALQFGFKSCRKANKCKITLNALDLYDIEFFKYNRRTFDCPRVKEYSNIYADQLTEIFKSFTGLATSL